MNNILFLDCARIYLRRLDLDDVQGNYSRWLNDNEVCKFNSHHRFPQSILMLQNYVNNVSNSDNQIVLSIICKESNQHIGNISLQNINYIDKNAEVAFLLGEKKYWGKGYSKEAAIAIINHAFNHLNLQRIYCGTNVRNISMQKLAESLGFKQEGMRREAIYKSGKYDDVLEYGLLKREWKFCNE